MVSAQVQTQPATLAALKVAVQQEFSRTPGDFALAFKCLSKPDESLLIREHESFHAASTMKTPVMIEVYKQASLGKLSLRDSVVVKNQFSSIVDGSSFQLNPDDDSEKELYEVIGRKKPLEDLVLNTSGLVIIPITIMTYRAQMGAADPSDIFIPALIATFCTAFTGLVIVALFQRINLFDKVIVAYLGTILLLIAGVIYYFTTIPQEQVGVISSVASNVLLFSIIILFIGLALYRRINVYDTFIEGAKEGFQVAVRIIPYLVAMLVAIGVFRASGAMNMVVDAMGKGFALLGFNTDFVPALPVALMKPLSGGGARGLMLDTLKTYGVDSFVGRTACVLNGASETTFYVLAVYFGSVNVKNTRYAVTAGLLADLAGVIAAISMSYLFFH